MNSRGGRSRGRSGARKAVLGVRTGFYWQGKAFYVQIERCVGIAEQVVSVRIDEDKYRRSSEQLRLAIEEFFDGQLPVEVIDVPALYAMEVRIMPDEAHPRHGREYTGEAAEGWGAELLFSKITSQKWPVAANVIEVIKRFCLVPLQLTLLGCESEVGNAALGQLPPGAGLAVNADVKGNRVGRPPSGQTTVPLCHSTLSIMHHGAELQLMSTDASGEGQITLFPGVFTLLSGEETNHDRLFPSSIAMASRFASVNTTVIASMKKKCTFFVVDHHNRHFPHFPLKIESKESRSDRAPVRLTTRADGRCRGRLGRGVYEASFDAPEDLRMESWSVVPFKYEFEVRESDAKQFFQLCVTRKRFAVNVVLRTKFEELVVRCPWVVKNAQGLVAEGLSSSSGVVVCELPIGRYPMYLVPTVDMPYEKKTMEIHIFENGSHMPMDAMVETKFSDVVLSLITPDGLPAPNCTFTLVAKFSEHGGIEQVLCSNGEGQAKATMSMLEPYIFKVRETGKASEYMTQEFVFMTDTWSVIVVVARSVFGVISESNVAFVVDASGSMQPYLANAKSALNLALVQQFRGSDRMFNIISFTGRQEQFSSSLGDSTARNLENAMRFCECISPGGRSRLLDAIIHTLRIPDLHAMYVVTDGKTEIDDDFQRRLKAYYSACANKPKIHLIGINCPPQRLTYRGLRRISNIGQGNFRAICMEPQVSDLDGRILGVGGGSTHNDSLQCMTTDVEPEQLHY